MSSQSGDGDLVKRHMAEASFFDRVAESHHAGLEPLHPETLRRYRFKRRRRFSKEFRLSLMGDLADKRILDVGCGEGGNAALLATLGARVTGVDISPKSIEIARERARLNHIDDRTEFMCGPFETIDLPENTFDIIWGDNILHHIIPTLDQCLGKLTRLCKHEGVLIFAEPINFNQTLRKIRFMVPVHTEVTPGERPLERAEIECIQKYLSEHLQRRFSLFSRLNRFILHNGNYERSSAPRRALSNAILAVDSALLPLPGIRNLAGDCVIYGRPNR